MQELVYLIKVSSTENVQREIARRLLMETAPSHVRIATIAPLSNWGYQPGADATVLSIQAEGVVFGVEGRPDIPRAFVPWTNIAYFADGASLATQQQSIAQTREQVNINRGGRGPK